MINHAKDSLVAKKYQLQDILFSKGGLTGLFQFTVSAFVEMLVTQ